LKQYRRYSAAVTRTKRWKALRVQALRRDGWKCVECGSRSRLQVDHILSVRTHPELKFELSNLQTLCGQHHGRKTAVEVGITPLDPERQRWRDLVRAIAQSKT
jgi:5-methylcytosine-specific restriction protein A